MLRNDEAESSRMRREAAHDEVHLFGQAETLSADLQQRPAGNEHFQLACERLALLAWHTEDLRELTRGGRMADAIPDLFE
jgi:hypothetical protein